MVSVQAEDFDAAAELEALGAGLGVGAVATFTGLCRDEGGALSALELECYPAMAQAEIGRVAAAAQARWPLLGVRVIHRYGLIAPGSRIVFVAAASAHRAPAFEAAEFLMDYLKTRAPFWKKQHFADGAASAWVDAREEDDAAAARWSV